MSHPTPTELDLPVSTVPGVQLVAAAPADAEVLVVGLYENGQDSAGREAPATAVETAADGLAGITGLLEDAAVEALAVAATTAGASSKVGATTRLPRIDGVRAESVLLVGLGPRAAETATDTNVWRRAIGAAVRAARRATTVTVALAGLDDAERPAVLRAATEGAVLGGHEYRGFKKADPKDSGEPRTVVLVAPGADGEDPGDAEADAVTRGVITAEAVATARDLVNTPPSHLYPETFAERARELGASVGLECEILDEVALAANGYGGIVGVGKGSARPPRLVRLHYRGGPGADARETTRVALVGKGVTFDTGGISIKPAAGMDQMTSDMGGAAAVIATVCAVARLGLPIEIIATVPMAENMPSSTAYRPGDVLRQYGGTTVEVLNTDAEGRLILADALVRACEDGPGYLIDTATLTGAQLVALGRHTPGVMGTPAFRDRVAELSREVGEGGWAMPLPAELREKLDSRVADLANVGPDRWGGMLLAAVFLREFVADGIAWAHLDIAGPAYNDGSAHDHVGKGGTGVPVRTMLAVIEELAGE